MKRIVIVVLLVALTMQVAANDCLGFQVGYAQPTTCLNSAGNKDNLAATMYNGFKVGLVYDAMLIKGFGVSMGLNYTFGANTTPWESVGKLPYPKTRSKSFYHQLEIPIDWQYKFEIAQNTWVTFILVLHCNVDLILPKRILRTMEKKLLLLMKIMFFPKMI